MYLRAVCLQPIYVFVAMSIFICSFGIVSELEMHTAHRDNKVESGIKIYLKQQRSSDEKKYEIKINEFIYECVWMQTHCICAFNTLNDSMCMMCAVLLLLLLFKHSVYIFPYSIWTMYIILCYEYICLLLFPVSVSLRFVSFAPAHQWTERYTHFEPCNGYLNFK